MADIKPLAVKGRMFSVQAALPKFPVAPLQQTLDKYLQTLRPLVTDAEFKHAQKVSFHSKPFLTCNLFLIIHVCAVYTMNINNYIQLIIIIFTWHWGQSADLWLENVSCYWPTMYYALQKYMCSVLYMFVFDVFLKLPTFTLYKTLLKQTLKHPNMPDINFVIVFGSKETKGASILKVK